MGGTLKRGCVSRPDPPGEERSVLFTGSTRLGEYAGSYGHSMFSFGERARLAPGLTFENNHNIRLQFQAPTATGTGLPGRGAERGPGLLGAPEPPVRAPAGKTTATT